MSKDDQVFELGPEEAAIIFNNTGGYKVLLPKAETEVATTAALMTLYCTIFLKDEEMTTQVAEKVNKVIEEAENA